MAGQEGIWEGKVGQGKAREIRRGQGRARERTRNGEGGKDRRGQGEGGRGGQDAVGRKKNRCCIGSCTVYCAREGRKGGKRRGKRQE